MKLFITPLLLPLYISEIYVHGEDKLKIPDDLSIGTATSAYQVEGGWNRDGKSENVWDRITHEKPWEISDRSNGDVAADSYYKFKEDIHWMKTMNLDHYRFSLSWSRILPTGFANNINYDGLKYYIDLIDELRANMIEPYVTLYHWDHPQILEDFGGWTNDLMVDWFADYARVVFQQLGPKVKVFITINEPNIVCDMLYGGKPGKNFTLHGNYLCGHNILKAHARVYHMYDKEYRKEQGGIIGIVIACQWYYNLYANDSSGEAAYQFSCGWFAHPIFSEEGDYPPIMRQRISENNRAQGLRHPRLPVFTKEWIQNIKGSSDYFGLNHYTSYLTYSVEGNKTFPWYNDVGVEYTYNETWDVAASPWLRVVPDGFGKLLRKIRDDYGNPPVYIMENGYSDNRTELYDPARGDYLYSYMKEMLLAVDDGCHVKCYTVWSLLDNFEWTYGYTQGFGLISVDFEDQNRKRSPKVSSYWFSLVLSQSILFPFRNFEHRTIDSSPIIVYAD